MIVPDTNLLVYAYNADAPAHDQARRWLEDLLSGETLVGIPWIVLHGFLRIITHPRIMERPMAVATALRHIGTWVDTPPVTVLNPGTSHLMILTQLLSAVGFAGNLTTDAAIAAIAIEHQAELHSNDIDYGRFPGLRWLNPLE